GPRLSDPQCGVPAFHSPHRSGTLRNSTHRSLLMTTQPHSPQSVMVTGAGGNLGRKVAEALAQQPWCRKVIGVDIKAAANQQQQPGSVLQYISSDLTRRDASW